MVSRKSLSIYLVLKWACTVHDRMAILLERYWTASFFNNEILLEKKKMELPYVRRNKKK